MITPRTTRLVRAADLRSFRSALAALATGGSPLEARDRLLVCPTRAASHHLLRSIEDRMPAGAALVLPDFVTRAELHERLFERIAAADEVAPRKGAPCEGAPCEGAAYTTEEREALLAVACRAAIDAGAEPPFRVRPGLIGAMLEFFDALGRHQKSVDDFERLTIGRLDGGQDADRGAERLVRQTRFFAAAFRELERLCAASGGVDEHAMRDRLLAHAAAHPWRHVIVAVRDRAGDRYGLFPVDWDLLARIPGLERLDVVVTDTMLAGSFHERIHQWLPGIEETRLEPAGSGQRAAGSTEEGLAARAFAASCQLPAASFTVARDREDEVASFARQVRADARAPEPPALDGIAIVVRQRLPYVYLAREVFRSQGIPCQMFDALPLAAEPYAAAVDLLFSFVSANFARVPAVALLRSPHLRFPGADGEAVRAGEIAALDRALSEAGYLGGLDSLDRLVDTWRAGSRVSKAAVAGASVLQAVAREMTGLRCNATIAAHLDRLLTFLAAHENVPGSPNHSAEAEPLHARQLRARGAVLGVLRSLRDAYERVDSRTVPFDEVAAMVRRGIDMHTFASRRGESGVHLVDAESAPFGEFDHVQLAGLVDGEWPDRPRRNIFYSPAILRDLGWPADADRVDAERAAFADLLRLPAKTLGISTFSLEHDSLVSPSMLLDEIERTEARAGAGEEAAVLSDAARAWAARRAARPADSIAGGQTAPYIGQAYSVSALERYQDCPFKFFAADVLELEELPEDEAALSPRARGRFIHEVFQRFFEAWDRRREGRIAPETLDAARAVFADVAAPLLAHLPDADAALERTRLFGSAISVGIVDVVLGLEATRPADVVERWLEYRLDGEFTLGAAGGRAVPLRGVADRIDLLAGNRLRVIDYKSGAVYQPKRALQVPIYALCAQERLAGQRGGTWQVDEAAYVAFTGKRSLVPIVRAGRDDQDSVLADARGRLLDLISAIERGEFPPRPYEPRICSYCAYPSVCRKDYIGDE
ncbi:MAG TPA: PD-(D/E)XK nuclease family protein [Vicinamibacterales bacterium]|nr:PD-(D/E)XK nuclease family protein [Vicinamibacterales bacterium]